MNTAGVGKSDEMHELINKVAPLETVNCGAMRAYRILDLIGMVAGCYAHDCISLYRASSLQDGSGALLKMLDPGMMLPEQMTCFRAEYKILQSLDLPGVVKPIALVDEARCLMMILEDVSGELLENILTRQRLDLPACLRLAPQLARILAGLHAAHLIQQDMRPANLMMAPEGRICLIDLSLATPDIPQTPTADKPLGGDWAYRSPEQTGRMNHPVDYRTDFYTLGVTLYRMLTGELPCHGNDALEWAHCHIARLPQPPSKLCPDIPSTLSDIVMKLLAKMPEDRYQSAGGLQFDLDQCQAQWEASGAITPFALGTHDVAERLQIPQKLVDREAEVKLLLASFEAMVASGRTAMLLVCGAAGVGKSVLVHGLRQSIAARRGYFISGKFDQYQGEIPYATVTQAFRELVAQILAENEARIADWRQQIQKAVGANGQLIIDVLPQVELIIGPQAPVPELPPAETQNRFRIVFEQFIGVFAQQAHPLTLFLDDIQRADDASLRLVRDLMTSPDQRFLLVIGAYRDNEVDATHPLTLALDDIRKDGAAITQFVLTPLSEEALRTFIDVMLQCEHCMEAPVAHLLYQKTAGNPFFVIQFLTALVDEHLLTFDASSGTWNWDLDRISARGYTDNVATFMIDKLAHLPVPAQAALQWLACLGSGTPEAMLVQLCGQPEADTQAALSAAVRAGLILRAEDTVRFLHDRVQEAAYLSIPAGARAALHRQIGRLLMADKSQAQIEEAIFSIVGQFNRGLDAITETSEKALLCRLNFLAGKKAKAAIAYTSARSFLAQAQRLLPTDAWEAQYQASFELTLALSECEFLIADFQRADQLTDLILAHAQSRRDRARVHRLRMQLYQMAGRYHDAVSTMFEAARLFDVNFPETGPEIEAAIDTEVRDIAILLEGRRIADIVDSPPLTDADMGMVIALLVESIPPVYITQPAYFALVTAKAVNLSVRYGGHTEESCLAFGTYGIVLISRIGDIKSAMEFAEMALLLNQKLDGRRLKGRLLVTHAVAFTPWENSFASAMPILDQAFAASLEVGDLVNANIIAVWCFWPMLQQGGPLDAVLDMVRRQGAFARKCHNEPIYQTIRFQQQLVANLKGQTRGPASFDDDDFNESMCFAALEKANFGFGIQISYIAKQISAFLYGDYASALVSAQQASLKSHNANHVIVGDCAHHFYWALTLAALYPQASGPQQQEFAEMLAEELQRHQLWAEHCPQNFLHCHALVGAEIARIEGRASDAEQLYEQAIRSARDNGFVQNEAIAFELASAFYRVRGFELIADTYLREARAGYLRWGAAGKVDQLDSRYPQLRTQPAAASGLAQGSAATPLDVLSIAKASQAISSRIVLKELADTLLHIVLENAGAQTACLLLCGSAGLELAAEAHADQAAFDTAPDAAPDQAAVQVRFYDRQAPSETSLPVAILNYVRNSREQVLLPDAAQPSPFSADPYFSLHHPQSVLCLPILHQDALIGLLYLENNLVTHAFAPERLTVLKLLASQAAISLENAQLYTDLQEREARIRRLVDSNIIGVIFGDLSGGISEANDAFLQLCGYTRQDMDAGTLRWSEMTPPEWRVANEQAIEELKRTGICTPYEREYFHKDGHRVPVLVGSAMIEGSKDLAVGFTLDLSARKQAEQQVRHMADHDALTGLPNRILLQDLITLAIALAHRNHSQVAILFIDLDYFKNINDSLGHHFGDVVLQMTAKRLQQCLREGDRVARLGGDEFVLSLPLLNDSRDAALVAQKSLDTLAQPFSVEGHELHVSGSIGISLYPDDGSDAETLMHAADTAMYHAKEMGRGNFQFFTAALNQQQQQRLDVRARLRHALDNDEFVLHYQPQVDIQSGMTFAVEALLRWQPPGTQPISCGEFIANAEESGLIVPIGEWILRQACKQLKIWRDAGHPDLKMAVNLSPRQVEQADFCILVGQVLEESCIPATSLDLEITESILLQHDKGILATLTQLKEMGIQLSVDDFGTGYSSLSYLQRFPVHALKIDRSFVRDIGTDPNNTALVTAIIAMANSLHLKVLAEGVETLQQAQFLLTHGCAAAQGFYYSQAFPAETVSDLFSFNPILMPVSQPKEEQRH